MRFFAIFQHKSQERSKTKTLQNAKKCYTFSEKYHGLFRFLQLSDV